MNTIIPPPPSPNDVQAPSATVSAGSPNTACVYYDGGCPLCRAEIETYRRAEGGEALRWIDVHGCEPYALGPDLDRATALARMHVRRADGTLVQGAAAFVEIWSALPKWQWLARLARVPGVVSLMELGYRAFLRLRPLWRPAPAAADTLPRHLLRELRTDHAGETGAVMIYRGVLAVTGDPALRDFARHHLDTERRHLALLEAVVAPRWRSRLLPLWRLSGWLTGALPALFGPRAVYATVQAVETFVDRHYAAQVRQIDSIQALARDQAVQSAQHAATDGELQRLRELLEQCRLDEVAHRDDAAARWEGRAGIFLEVWRALVGRGSAAAVAICRRV